MNFRQDSYDSNDISSGYVRAGDTFDQVSGYWTVEKVYFVLEFVFSFYFHKDYRLTYYLCIFLLLQIGFSASVWIPMLTFSDHLFSTVH
jgi:hypothetical protein